jgi:cytochrome b561
VILRLSWRLYAGTPTPVPGTPSWQERIASVTHWLLYALILAQPISGWLYDSASGLRPFRWFGLFDVPKLTAPDEALSRNAMNAHELIFWALVALVAVHAGAALYHHLFRRDATLARMLPRGWLKTSVAASPLASAAKPEEPPHVV